MSNQHQLVLGPMEVPSRVSRGTDAGAADGPDGVPTGTDGLSLLIDAVRESHCAEKEAFIPLGLPDHSYWGKVKSREKPAPRITRLLDLPVEVQRAYVKQWGRQLGMHVTDEDRRRAALANAAIAMAEALREIG